MESISYMNFLVHKQTNCYAQYFGDFLYDYCEGSERNKKKS